MRNQHDTEREAPSKPVESDPGSQQGCGSVQPGVTDDQRGRQGPQQVLAGALQAIRLATAWSEADATTLAAVRIHGEHAFEATDALVAAPLYLRDGQLLHSLILRPDATPLADVYVGRDDEDYLLLADGVSAAALADFAAAQLPAGLSYAIDDLRQTYSLLSLHGPYAWELLEHLTSPDVIGLPYLNFFRFEDWLCFRTGKTGEYGYDLLVPSETLSDVKARLQQEGAAYDLQHVDAAALSQCSLENWFFNIHQPGLSGLTPLELQLQWRVSYQKDFVGSAALRKRREDGIGQRICCVVSGGPLAVDDPVFCADEAIGTLVVAGYSSTRGDWVAVALLQRAYAHAGLSGFHAIHGGERVALRTVSPPLLDNRSLHVNPQRHRYATRAGDRFPPIVPGQGSGAGPGPGQGN